MTPDRDMPKLGDGARGLGVRVPGIGKFESADIIPDQQGNVRPGIGGMSVAPSIAALPSFRIPRRLRHLFPQATGNNHDVVWKHGADSWRSGWVATDLTLRIDQPDHGLVEPIELMSLDKYQLALGHTQAAWTNAEPR